MKINKNKTRAIEQFKKNIKISFRQYYKQALSENIKRGLEAKNKKKLSTFD